MSDKYINFSAIMIASGLVFKALLYSLLALVPVLAYYSITSRRPRDFPPGPKGLPIIGNVHLLPTEKPFLKFADWAREYGPVYSLKFASQNVVVLNDPKDVEALFDKRGLIFSDRPRNYVFNDLITTPDTHILFLPYGGHWKRQRRAITSFLKADAKHLLPIQEAESVQLVHDLLHGPSACYNHLRRFATAVILASVYGLRGKSYSDPDVQATYDVHERVSAILAPGSTPPVDTFSFLKWIPRRLASWKQEALSIHDEHHDLYRRLFEATTQRTLRGRPDCMIAKLIREQAENGMSDMQIVYSGTPMLEAGSDTTSSTLQSFVLAMAEHPEVLWKMQSELDEVCGRDRLPGPNDLQSLPYTYAVMMETLRWRPAIPLGIPHVLSQDDTFKSYHFPKGTMFFANTWAINFDETRFEDPQVFKPERFMINNYGSSKESSHLDEGRNRTTCVFGAGRRVCVGQQMAEHSLMLAMSMIAWAFDIEPDESQPLSSDIMGYVDGLSLVPKPFTALFNARSQRHRETIERQWKTADGFLAQFER